MTESGDQVPATERRPDWLREAFAELLVPLAVLDPADFIDVSEATDDR